MACSETSSGYSLASVRLAPLVRPPSTPGTTTQKQGHLPRPTPRARLPGSDFGDQAHRYLQGLEDPDATWRCNSAGRLSLLVESSSEAAEAIAAHAPMVVKLFGDANPGVRGAAMNVLQALADAGHARAVSMYAPDFMACLRDEEASVRRKAISLCWTVAQQGCAGALATYVPQIVAALESKSSLRVTPLRALAAMADGGEARVVALEAKKAIMNALRDRSIAVRIAACDAIAALARAGCDETFLEGMRSGVHSWPILEALLSCVLNDRDDEVQLAGSKALGEFASIANEGIESFCQKHRNSLRSLAHLKSGANGAIIREAISKVIGISISPEKSSEVQAERSVLPQQETRADKRMRARARSCSRRVQSRRRCSQPSTVLRDGSNTDDSDDEMHIQRQPLRKPKVWGRPNSKYLHVMVEGMPNTLEEDTDRDPRQPTCVICQGSLTKDGSERTALRCGHVFHHACIETWLCFQETQTCPLCRCRPTSAGRR